MKIKFIETPLIPNEKIKDYRAVYNDLTRKSILYKKDKIVLKVNHRIYPYVFTFKYVIGWRNQSTIIYSKEGKFLYEIPYDTFELDPNGLVQEKYLTIIMENDIIGFFNIETGEYSKSNIKYTKHMNFIIRGRTNSFCVFSYSENLYMPTEFETNYYTWDIQENRPLTPEEYYYARDNQWNGKIMMYVIEDLEGMIPFSSFPFKISFYNILSYPYIRIISPIKSFINKIRRMYYEMQNFYK